MAVGSQAIEVGCVVLLESGHIELPVSNEFVKNKTAVAMGGRWVFLGGFSDGNIEVASNLDSR